MNIYPVNNDPKDRNRFCGPAVLSAITKMSTGEASRLLRHITGKASIKGTTTGQMQKAFGLCNVTMRRSYHVNLATKPTLTGWLRATKDIRTPGRVFLIEAGNHWQLVSGRRFVCGLTREVVSIKDKKVKRRARVANVYELISDGVRISVPAPARKPKSSRVVDPARKDLKALEKQYGFKGSIVPSSDIADYIVEPCEMFPEGLGTMHHCWSETLERVYAAIEDPSIIEDGWVSF